MQKTLYILRHAKAERGQDDHDRPLAPHGMEEAGDMGKYLNAQGIRVDKVLCSTALRCRETLAALHILDNGCQIIDKLYLASANEMLGLIAAQPETVHSLMIIGHNPGLHELCMRLAKEGDNALRSRLSAEFPTCALATLTFDGAWGDSARAQATLAGFVTPKTL